MGSASSCPSDHSFSLCCQALPARSTILPGHAQGTVVLVQLANPPVQVKAAPDDTPSHSRVQGASVPGSAALSQLARLPLCPQGGQPGCSGCRATAVDVYTHVAHGICPCSFLPFSHYDNRIYGSQVIRLNSAKLDLLMYFSVEEQAPHFPGMEH